MEKNWIPLESIAPGGETHELEDQDIWVSLFKEYGLDCKITQDIKAKVFILLEDSGVLLSGDLQGQVALPCDRCTEDCLADISSKFQTFEPYPEAGGYRKDSDEEDLDEADESIIRPALRGNGIDLNITAYVWQELSLALPIKPLCSTSCKGLCPKCGADKNNEECDCVLDEGDPRFAKLRGLVINK